MASRGRAAQAEVEPAPRSDAYTGILAVSLLAMIVGIVLLVLDFNDYEFQGKAPPVPTDAVRPGANAFGGPAGVQPAAPGGEAPPAPGGAAPAAPGAPPAAPPVPPAPGGAAPAPGGAMPAIPAVPGVPLPGVPK